MDDGKNKDGKILESDELSGRFSNPLRDRNIALGGESSDTLNVVSRPRYDGDIEKILEIVRILNNVSPVRMPEYNFNADEINGERFYKPDGTLLFIRDFDNDVIRDYYYNPNYKDPNYSISRILEHDKNTGRLKIKIEPITRQGSKLKTNIAIFDDKIKSKYTIIQLSEGGIVNNISEFSGDGKSFQTLFRDIHTLKPVRYLEGKDDIENGFTMIDCIFTRNGDIARLKKYHNKKETVIDFSSGEKYISIKST